MRYNQTQRLEGQLVTQTVKRICLQCRRPRFHPWVRKLPWRRKWQSIPVFLPGESDGQRSRQATVCGVERVGHYLPTKVLPETIQFSSVQFSHSFVSDSLRLHELQHARPPCLSPSPGVHSDSRPSLKINIFKSLFKSKFTQTHVHQVSDAI